MFVRFRPSRDRLQASLVEPHRVAGKVRHEHLAGVGSIEVPMTVESRLVFWRKVEGRLAKLGNRVSADDAARIRGALFARIPLPSVDEQAAVQLANAQADAKLFAALHDMHAAVVTDHERFATTVESKIAEGRAVLADAAARLSATRERVAAIERGEAVAGGLAAGHFDIEAALRADGWSDADIQHCCDLAEVFAIARRLGGADQSLADKVDRAITESSVAAGQAAQRKLVRRLLVELRALEPEPGDQVPALAAVWRGDPRVLPALLK
jgi:hypothetical protein